MPRRKIHRPNRPRAPRVRVLHDNDRVYRTQAWLRFRAAFLAEHPLCTDCPEHSQREATEVHHTRGLREHPEDAYDPEQCQALCKSCHSKRTARGE